MLPYVERVWFKLKATAIQYCDFPCQDCFMTLFLRISLNVDSAAKLFSRNAWIVLLPVIKNSTLKGEHRPHLSTTNLPQCQALHCQLEGKQPTHWILPSNYSKSFPQLSCERSTQSYYCSRNFRLTEKEIIYST